MPKYFNFKVADCYLYYTMFCLKEAFHVHASKSKRMTEFDSAKFFVGEDGQASIERRGNLTNSEINIILDFIKDHYKEMYIMWSENPNAKGFYNNIEQRVKKMNHSREDFSNEKLCVNEFGIPIIPWN